MINICGGAICSGSRSWLDGDHDSWSWTSDIGVSSLGPIPFSLISRGWSDDASTSISWVSSWDCSVSGNL